MLLCCYFVTERKSIDIGIEIEDITEVKVYNSADSISFIFLKTTESCSAVIRGILGMNDTEESKGHFSAASKSTFQYFSFVKQLLIIIRELFKIVIRKLLNQI